MTRGWAKSVFLAPVIVCLPSVLGLAYWEKAEQAMPKHTIIDLADGITSQQAKRIGEERIATWDRYANTTCSIAFFGNMIAGALLGLFRVRGRYLFVFLMALAYMFLFDMRFADTTLGPVAVPVWFLVFGVPAWIACLISKAIWKVKKAPADEPKLQSDV